MGEIATQYNFDSPDPIFFFNTDVHRNIPSRDRDKIVTGSTFAIPRSHDRYNRVLDTLKELQLSVVADSKEIEKELGVIKREADNYGKNIDLVSELATLTVTGGAQVARLGSKRLAKMLIKKKTLQATQKVVAAALPSDGADTLVIDKALDHVRRTTRQSLKKLSTTIEKLEDERAKTYSGSNKPSQPVSLDLS